MKKPTKTPLPTHRQGTNRQAERQDTTPTHASPRHGTSQRHGTNTASPPHRIEYRDGRRDGNGRKAITHSPTARHDREGNERETAKTGQSDTRRDGKQRENNQRRTRENEENGTRKRIRAHEPHGMSEKNDKNRTRREQGNRRRRPGGDIVMTTQACNSRFNR